MSQAIFKDNLGYEGKVKLTLRNRKHILQTKTYKNSGTSKLFEFLGHCLAGSFDFNTKRLLPTKLALLYNTAEDSELGKANATEVIQQSSFIGLAQSPAIIMEEDGVKVIYSFEVPRNQIAGTFNQIALYGAGVTTPKEFSAYYYLTDGASHFENQRVNEWSSTTILLIEWELTLTNKNETNIIREGETN